MKNGSTNNRSAMCASIDRVPEPQENPMTCTTRARTVWDVACPDCMFREVARDEATASDLAAEHDARHVRFGAVGPTLEGKVFDTNGPDKPFYSVADKAREAALARDFGYYSWNGYVHSTGSSDLSSPVCRATDVPGVTT